MKRMPVCIVIVSLCIFILLPLSGLCQMNQYRYFNRGKRYMEVGDYDKAIRDFSRAIELESKYVFAYTERGLAWEMKGFHEKALADYDKAVSINPEYGKTYKYRAFTWEAMGEYVKAIDDCKKAIELNPDDSEAFYQMGSIYCKQKDEKDALQFLEMAFKNGYHDFKTLEKDPVWDDVRNTSDFQELIQRYKNQQT